MCKYESTYKCRGLEDFTLRATESGKDLHENHKEEAQVHRQMKQVPDKFQVKCVDRLPFPLSLHKHVTNIEHILDKC